MIVDIQD